MERLTVEMLTALLLASVLQGTGSTVVYSRASGVDLAMDIYRPATNAAPGAAVVLIHGGAWMSGDRKWMAPLAKALAKEGFLAASVSYRLAPASKWPAMLDDVQTAVRFLRSRAREYHLDPNRIGAMGESAGGQLALLLGTIETRDPQPKEYPGVSSRVSAVFDIYGPSDFSRDFPASFDVVYQLVLGKPREQAAAEIRSASPAHFVTAGSAPTFILHGTADTVVPVAQSRHMHQKLREAGVPTELVVIEGMAHRVDGSRADVRNAVRRGIEFLRHHLSRAGRKAA